ncbi:MAG: TetR/AcrR family transcriptional regulator [Anaerolineales bacterium]|nr:TetR/AcrR family transcriptional regulator [Anaerolineales bacterium]
MSLKDRIVDQSLKLFSLNGYWHTSVTDILEAAGTSKGGFYNHFASKEDLFFAVLEDAQRIWREKTLIGLNEIDDPLEKIEQLLLNYRDRYLKDGDTFPGGCLFVTFSVELDDQNPKLCAEVNKGFVGLKRMLKGFLDQAKADGLLNDAVNIKEITEMLFAGMLGASVLYGVDKSGPSLNLVINSFINYVKALRA